MFYAFFRCQPLFGFASVLCQSMVDFDDSVAFCFKAASSQRGGHAPSIDIDVYASHEDIDRAKKIYRS